MTDDERAARHPVGNVRWVPADRVHANDYNMNAVAPVEMKLLATSILHDGITQPIVTVEDEDRPGHFVIVDGFHRTHTIKNNPELLASTGGCIPIVVIEKSINDRMAATVRHNRARGKHSVTGMSSTVFKMLENGWEDEAICEELGMEPEELIKLKHLTGFSKLFENAEYKKAWVTKRQIQIEKAEAAKGG